MREPGPDHPITITPHPKRVRVTVGGTVVAETTRALALQEASYPTVLYIPREDANWQFFAHNPRSTHCPYKGDASYYDLTVDGTTLPGRRGDQGPPRLLSEPDRRDRSAADLTTHTSSMYSQNPVLRPWALRRAAS